MLRLLADENRPGGRPRLVRNNRNSYDSRLPPRSGEVV
jgi:hypothetical protein